MAEDDKEKPAPQEGDAPAEPATGPDAQSAPTPAQPAEEAPPEPGTPASSRADAKAPRNRAGSLALLLVLLLAGAAGFGAWYLWQELQELRTEREAFASASEVRQLEEQLSTASRQAQEAQARLAALAQDRAELDQELVRQQEALGELTNNQQALAQRMSRIDAMAEAYRSDWTRAEAAYLARIAVHRLRFHRDVDAALDALRMADALLAELGTEAIAQRQAVNRAVERLLRVEMPSTEELATRLDALLDVLPSLPLVREVERTENEPMTPDPAAAEDWREALNRAWARFKETLGELVIVQRERDVVPLLAPPERYFLFQNLRLGLQSARLALLNGDPSLYRRSLQQSEEWLAEYYDREDPRVEAVRQELRSLAEVAIAPALPDIEPVLEPIFDRN